MVQVKARYTGSKHCEILHLPSGSSISTDAPKDNHGKGETFSPTDLMAAALGSCILTIMAIMAEKDGVSIEGAEVLVTKEMLSNPRRIGRLPAEIKMPAGIPREYRRKLEAAAHACPVHQSLPDALDAPLLFSYPD